MGGYINPLMPVSGLTLALFEGTTVKTKSLFNHKIWGGINPRRMLQSIGPLEKEKVADLFKRGKE